MKFSIWWPTYGNSIRMGRATSRMGGATSFHYPPLPSRFKSLLNAPWTHIGTLMRRLPAEPRSIAGHLFPSQCPSVTILLTPDLMVWDWQVSRGGPMLFYWTKLLYSPFLFFLSIGCYCGAGAFGLIGCISLSALHCRPFFIIIIIIIIKIVSKWLSNFSLKFTLNEPTTIYYYCSPLSWNNSVIFCEWLFLAWEWEVFENAKTYTKPSWKPPWKLR